MKILLCRKFPDVLAVPVAGGFGIMEKKNKTFSLPLFFRLSKRLTSILADVQFCSEERTGIMLDDKHQQFNYMYPCQWQEGGWT